jgi:OmcA/MtrC family decaheme c-type cytochrome
MASPHARRGGPLALLALLAAACGEPKVGGKVVPPPSPTGYRLAITGASIDATSHVVATFTVTSDSAPLALADVVALRPAFTLAGLLTDPVSGLDTWQSYLLTGSGTLANLPLGGPGTPPAQILRNQTQPGSVTGTDANLADLGDGRFTVTVGTPLPAGLDPTRTMRVGGWLGTATGTVDTSATYDWVPAGGTPAQRATVLDANCAVCHGLLVGHGRRTGVKLCLTCHTIQNADPDTQDPAALARALTVQPDQRTVLAGTGKTTFTATLLSSTATVTWAALPAGSGTLSTPVVAATASGSTSTVSYTPPAPDAAAPDPLVIPLSATVTVASAASGGYTPPPVTLTAPATITVLQPPAAPAAVMTPSAQTVLANGPALSLTALFPGGTGAVSWAVSPAGGAGTLGTATSAVAGAGLGSTVSYTPPGQVGGPTTVTVTATAGGVTGTATLTVLQGAPATATRFTDPNPLDLGRLVHRLHRGRNLPTLYLASSIAPAPALPTGPPVAPATGTLPLPFLVGRNALAVGTEYSIWGFRSTELIGGRVVWRVSNAQPAKLLAEGILFPRDLRDCAACHKGAPQEAGEVTAISRRTCQGCHPDVWFGTGPITDLVHQAHPGGPQGDDTRCAGCHVKQTAGQPWVPIADAHQPPLLSRFFDQPSIKLTGATNFQGGKTPTFTFRVADRVGTLGSLTAPTPMYETGPTASPVPRALTRLAIIASGPTSDYLTANAPLTITVLPTPAGGTLTGPDAVTGDFSYTPPGTTALPATAAGSWGIGLEARRAPAAAPTPYDPVTDTFRWPYTGEAVNEFADNPVYAVDTGLGSWTPATPPATPRRAAIDRARCNACHLDLSLHGGGRHNPEHCLLCHAPDGTDWSRRSKGPDGNVNLATVYSDTKFGTYDNLEERSIHFKVMVHRIHTGQGQGTARIEVGAPHVVSGIFLDDLRFPNRLADCTLCHPGSTWLLEGIPATAAPTTANETATILHSASAAHPATDPSMLPMAAACLSCHGTSWAYAHAAQYTVGVVEQCGQCHTKGALGVPTAHGLATPTTSP